MTRQIYSLKVVSGPKRGKPVLLECMGTLGTNWWGVAILLLLPSDGNNFNSGI